MAHGLVVIFGAGASLDCRGDSGENCDMMYRPPLARDVFDIKRFESIQVRHQDALGAIHTWREGKRNDIEAFLHTLDSGDNTSRRQAFGVRCYLQDLLTKVTTSYVTHMPAGTKYTALLDRLRHLKFASVAYINLNYDLFLDYAIQQIYFETLSSMSAFQSLPVLYMKPHGSVNWGMHDKETLHIDLDRIAELQKNLNRIEVQRGWPNSFISVRWREQAPITIPAIVPPVASKSQLLCPPWMEERLHRQFADTKQITLLTVGFAAKDEDVSRLLDPLKSKVRNVEIVDMGDEVASVATRLQEWGMNFVAAVHKLGFYRLDLATLENSLKKNLSRTA